MNPLKSPSPDGQNTLYSSGLQRMERPVRSFKSFIRVTPRAPDKPLPPVLRRPPLQKNPSVSSIATVQTRSTGLSLWESPTNWDNGEGSQTQFTPPFALRQYSPLIPEPPEDIAAMQADPVLWKQSNGSFQQTPLDPIHERTAATPDIPPRNPSRLSLSLSSPITTRKNSKDTLASISSRYSTNTDDGERLGECFYDTDLPSPLDLVSALSDRTMRERAFNSLGLGSPRDQAIFWDDPHQHSEPVQLKDDTHLDLQGNKLTIFHKGSVLADVSPVSLEVPEMSDRMQALSFAQDYHNVLTDRSSNDRDHAHDGLAPVKTPPKDQDLTPQPLVWNKSAGSSPTEPSPRPQLAPTTSSGRYQTIRKMSSWVSHRLRKEPQAVITQRSISDPGTLPHVQLPETEIDRHLKHGVRLANIIQHGKDLLARRLLHRESEPKKPIVVSHSRRQQFEASFEEPVVSSSAPFEMATPVFRLPGGLAIVRQTPSSSQRPQTAGESPSSTFSDLSWPDFTISSPFHRNFLRRNSCPSAISQPQQSPLAAIKQKILSSSDSHLVSRLFSYSTTSLANPQPQQSSSPPYSPPQLRRRSHNVGSLLNAPPISHEAEQHTDDVSEGSSNKLNLFEKAKNVRDVWKKQQKDAKIEKLKQSIRLIGPADAKNVAGYIKSAVDGRRSGDSGIGEGQFPVQMVKEVS